MNYLKKLTNELTFYSFLLMLISNVLAVGAFYIAHNVIGLNVAISVISAGVTIFALSLMLAILIVRINMGPLKLIWQAVWHISPKHEDVPTPDIEHAGVGRELVDAITREIYDLASQGNPSSQAGPKPNAVSTSGQALLEYMPLPVIALDSALNITFANQVAADYLGRPLNELTGKYLYDVLQMSFSGNETFDQWLKATKETVVTGASSWDRVRLQLPDNKGIRQFDLTARFTKGNTSGFETLIALFDHSEKYSSEDGKSSYVALAVHELRTPLTVLRGYIEVLEDELNDTLTPELKDFMHKMQASAQTLAAFVSNILNVARVDENQLTLSLHEANWNEMLPTICKDLELRVKVHKKVLELDIAPNLPTVAVDKISVYEVVSNLVDNAVKYSGESDKIIIHSAIGTDGSIETIVQDFGDGIPEGALQQLFTKYYRSHRSKGRVSGSGLGLYLVKAIINAHGGVVWVRSKEGEGSRFGFTLQPYAALAEGLKDKKDNGNIERQAFGWIKNHSMYRR